MTERTTIIGDRTFTMLFGFWTSDETVLVNGIEVSKQRNYRFVTEHVFTLEDSGFLVPFSVTMAGPFAYVIRREGQVIAEDVRLTQRLFYGFMLSFALVMALEVLSFGAAKLTNVSWVDTTAGILNEASSVIAVAVATVMARWVGRRVRKPPRSAGALATAATT